MSEQASQEQMPMLGLLPAFVRFLGGRILKAANYQKHLTLEVSPSCSQDTIRVKRVS